MAMWRCPHCGTPQPEAARCWVCRRSSTTCSTCRQFRASLAVSVGYCGLDRRRAPLEGTEHRGCWESPAAAGSAGLRSPAAVMPDGAGAPDRPLAVDRAVTRLRPERRPRPGVLEGFVPLEIAGRGPRTLRPVDPAPLPPPAVVETVESWVDRETLFGEP